MRRPEKRLISAGDRSIDQPKNWNQHGCKQGNINSLVCNQRFCASAKNLQGAQQLLLSEVASECCSIQECEMNGEWRCFGS